MQHVSYSSSTVLPPEGDDDASKGTDYDDVLIGTVFDDHIDGLSGNDYIDGWTGNDVLLGYDGDDVRYGEDGYDILKGEGGNDFLSGGDTYDDLYGGMGKDDLSGGAGADWFFVEAYDSGDIYAGGEDTILDFSHFDGDAISLGGHYDFAGNTIAPLDGQYSVWAKDNAWVVTWNVAGEDGYHDVAVYGDNPEGHIYDRVVQLPQSGSSCHDAGRPASRHSGSVVLVGRALVDVEARPGC